MFSAAKNVNVYKIGRYIFIYVIIYDFLFILLVIYYFYYIYYFMYISSNALIG